MSNEGNGKDEEKFKGPDRRSGRERRTRRDRRRGPARNYKGPERRTVATDAKAATVENPKNHREILAVSATAALPKANLVSTADAS